MFGTSNGSMQVIDTPKAPTQFVLLTMQSHVLPPSYYVMRKVLDVKEQHEVEWHACPLGCTGWAPLPKSEWHLHADDECQRCKGKRFTKQAGSQLAPSRVRRVESDVGEPGIC